MPEPDEVIVSKCRHCRAGIELDHGVGAGWPCWISTGISGSYFCGGREDWEGWFEGRVRHHEPIDQPDSMVA